MRTERIAALAGLITALAIGCGEEAVAAETQQQPRAEDFRSETVSVTLEAGERVIRTRGFEPDGDEWRGFLVDQGSETTEAPLLASQCYVVVAAGSMALRELDLRVFDADGSEVALDAQPGHTAALRYCPPHTGTYYVAALATAGTGLFGVRRYVGPTGLQVRVDDVFEDAPARPDDTTDRQ